MPLAVFLLSELLARPSARLDERHLSDVGSRARRDDRHTGQLVPGVLAAEADDGSAGMRRWRKPGPHVDPG